MEQNKSKSLAHCAAEQRYADFEMLFKAKVSKYVANNPVIRENKKKHDKLKELIRFLGEE